MPTVRLTAAAAEQLSEATEWWFANREKAPYALIDDVEALISMLEEHPELVGRPWDENQLIRRVHLQRVRYYLYFKLIPNDDVVEILAFWHERRGVEPML